MFLLWQILVSSKSWEDNVGTCTPLPTTITDQEQESRLQSVAMLDLFESLESQPLKISSCLYA